MKEEKMLEIDCRGLACPQPVITTKQALDQMEEGELIVIVDNASSCNNVERFAKSQGCSVKVEQKEKNFYLHLQKMNFGNETEPKQKGEKAKKIVVYINSNLLGGGMRTWVHS